MKPFLILSLLCCAIICQGQNIKIDTIKWISDDLSSLSFTGQGANFQFGHRHGSKGYRISKDTLIMVDDHTIRDGSNMVRQIDLFKFHIRHISPKLLKISPVDSNARYIAERKTYTFRNLSYLQDVDIKFTNLSFTSDSEHSSYHPIHVDIDAAGNFNLTGGKDLKFSSGPVTGKLTKPELDSLNYMIQHGQLKKMKNWKSLFERRDSPSFRIKISYDKKDIDIYTDSPPLNIQPLIDYLLTFNERLPLVKKL